MPVKNNIWDHESHDLSLHKGGTDFDFGSQTYSLYAFARASIDVLLTITKA